jgi:shikimate dehydrogenase
VLDGETQLAAVIGRPIRHSLSPVILNAAFAACQLDWAFVAFEVAEGEVPRALEGVAALGIRGLSVTMPHKEAVFAALERVSDDAQALRAVNCVVNDGGVLVGESTDGPGFLDALAADTGFDPAGKRAVVLGAGGAARAIVLALRRAGASDIAIVNRTRDKADAAALLAGGVGWVADASAVGAADLVVNATSVGMHDESTPVPTGGLHDGQVVADIIYHPAATPFLRAAAAAGATTTNGLGMLVHQAGHSFRRWTGIAPPLEAMERAARAAVTESR